jgi:hypothetical protein
MPFAMLCEKGLRDLIRLFSEVHRDSQAGERNKTVIVLAKDSTRLGAKENNPKS